MRIDKLTYVDKAESVIESLQKVNKFSGEKELKLTTSKIRNILSMVSQLYNDAVRCKETAIDANMQSRVQYLKMRIAYEAGRDKDVKEFVEKSEILLIINEIGSSKENLILFCNYMEALVAYHRYLGGKD